MATGEMGCKANTPKDLRRFLISPAVVQEAFGGPARQFEHGPTVSIGNHRGVARPESAKGVVSNTGKKSTYFPVTSSLLGRSLRLASPNTAKNRSVV